MTSYHDGAVTVIHGDLFDVLPGLEADSVDAVVCDPPYGLEFMGKSWDDPDQMGTVLTDPSVVGGFQDGAGGNPYSRARIRYGWNAEVFADWCKRWATEALRVVKPGGHLVAFGATRTHHRLMQGVEDAGWDIRDMGVWLYRCLTDDVDVLTDQGWKPGHEVRTGDTIATWRPADGAIVLDTVEDTFAAPYRGDMVRFRNHDTDQLVTPGHRVYLRQMQRRQVDGVRESHWPDEWEWQYASDVNRWQSMRLPTAGRHNGPGIGGTDYAALLGWVWTEGGFDNTGTGVRLWQSSVNQPHVDTIGGVLEANSIDAKLYERTRTYKDREYVESCWYWSGDDAERVRADLPGKRPTYELLWRMTQAEKVAFYEAAMAGDGSSDVAFYQSSRDDREWFATLLATIGKAGTLNHRKMAVSVRHRASTELQRRHLRYDRSRYEGRVWCVTVPSGAFVCRRNGRVFITGNSGFPKSLDVSKAIDKAAGAEREVVGPAKYADRGRTTTNQVYDNPTLPSSGEVVTAPATEAAVRWSGYGTSLKPAIEPWVLARAPLSEGTVAANVLRWGTGALNIDGCRAPMDDDGWTFTHTQRTSRAAGIMGRTSGARSGTDEAHEAGRWPANVVTGEPDHDLRHFRLSVGQVADFPKAQSSEKPWDMPANTRPEGEAEMESGGHARPVEGGELHPTVKPVDLMRHLVRLVTPPGGTVLDPFGGTGTTGQAALIEGRRAVLVEREAAYLPLIDRRLTEPQQPTLLGGTA